MPGSLFTWGIDYQNQPLLDAWWTPGWTSQNDAYVQVPPNQFAAPGFPSGLNYVTIVGNYYDSMADPLSGYLTFWPSSPLTITTDNSITYIPQRYSGINQTLLGVNQMGDGKIYLWRGQLSVSLLATDNASMSPASFTYHVRENYFEGLQYDIIVPSADASTAIDIHSLIIPGSVYPVTDDVPEEIRDFVRIAQTSSQPIAADISTIFAGSSFNPTSYPVQFAFISGPAQPQSSDWVAGTWANDSAPYVATIIVGPNGTALSPGTYQVWARVIATPIEPVTSVGFLQIY
jgi:hypothetical protein